MKAVILFLYGISACIAAPTVTTQYHAQDELGQYVYGYSGGPSAKHEEKSADGVTKGEYSYVDGHGLIQSAAYVSDPINGFRVAATNLPVGPAVPKSEVAVEKVEIIESAPVLIAADKVEAPVIIEESIKNEAENFENPEKPEVNYEMPEENFELPESTEKVEEGKEEKLSDIPVVPAVEIKEENTPVEVITTEVVQPVIKAAEIPVISVKNTLVPLHIAQQYHAQDELGQYVYGYSGGPSAKHEEKSFDGLTKGGYSYIDANGVIQAAAYVSDPINGFRITATNIPKQREPEYIPDSPEVAEAKAKLFKAQADHIAKLSS